MCVCMQDYENHNSSHNLMLPWRWNLHYPWISPLLPRHPYALPAGWAPSLGRSSGSLAGWLDPDTHHSSLCLMEQGADSLCCGLWNHLWSALTLCHHLEKPQLQAKHHGPEGSSAEGPTPLAALQHHFPCTDPLTEISAEKETWRRIQLLGHKCSSVYLLVEQWSAALGRGRDFTCKCKKNRFEHIHI